MEFQPGGDDEDYGTLSQPTNRLTAKKQLMKINRVLYIQNTKKM